MQLGELLFVVSRVVVQLASQRWIEVIRVVHHSTMDFLVLYVPSSADYNITRCRKGKECLESNVKYVEREYQKRENVSRFSSSHI